MAIAPTTVNNDNLLQTPDLLPPQQPVSAQPLTDFDTLLNEMLTPDSEGQVNEEQLFSALISERLSSLKGSEAADAYQTRFEEYQAEMQREDGYVPVESAARKALESLAEEGMISLEEAESIHAQAFKAAQIDENSETLYDSRGSLYDQTIAVTLVELALESAREEISRFDSGEADAGRLAFDLDFDNHHAAVFSGETQSTPAAADTTGDIDYADGLISKPTADSTGNLAMILPSSLQGSIETITIKDSSGKTIEQGDLMTEDEKGRTIFGFSQPGSQYPNNLTVQVALNSGKEVNYFLAEPADKLGW